MAPEFVAKHSGPTLVGAPPVTVAELMVVTVTVTAPVLVAM